MNTPSRRRFVTGAAAAILSGSAHRFATASQKDPRRDPLRNAYGQILMRSTLDGSIAAWAYSGTIYAVRPGERPQAILAVSGCQTEWARGLDDGSFRVSGMLLSFFRDLNSNAFIDSWQNPFTQRRCAVRPNRFSGASALYPSDGSAMHIEGVLAASESAPKGFDASQSVERSRLPEWTMTRDHVTLNVEHIFNARLQPQVEVQTHVADRSAFFDPAVVRLPSTYAASTVIPWLRWMEMEDVPGHLLWHTSGEKCFSIDALPDDYRRQAGAALDELAKRPPILDA